MPNTLYLVDGTSQLYRAYFALGHLSNAAGLPTHAVYGFTTMLRKLLREEQPAHLAVVFDPPGGVFRHDAYTDYKANRAPTPSDLSVQVPWAKQVCEALGVRVLEVEGYEADDVIATHARQAREAGFDVVIVASDKDLLQLVGDAVTVLDPAKNVRLNAAGVASVFGVPPERVADVLGLMGDSVDNIPGVPGVGQKTALALVAAYGDMEAVISRSHAFVEVWRARDALVEALDQAAASEKLAAPAIERIRESAVRLTESLHRMLPLEADAELRARLEGVLRALLAADVSPLENALGQPGSKALRSWAALKRELKALDRGSSKRVWFAVHDHAEQARLSRRLATLHDQVPVDLELSAFELAGPDRARARELFTQLEFKTLVADYADAGEEARPVRVVQPLDTSLILDREALDRFASAAARARKLALLPIHEGPPLRARLAGIAFAHTPGRAVYVPIGHQYLGAPAQLSLTELREAIGPLLEGHEVEKLAHDAKAAIHVLRGHGLPEPRFALDTRIAAFLLDSDRASYPIERLGELYLGRPATGEEAQEPGASGHPPTALPIESIGAWAARRVETVLAASGPLIEKLESQGLGDLYRRIDGPLAPVLARMEERGIRIDVELLGRMSQDMEHDLDEARRAIHRLAGGEFLIDSPKQLREVLFERLGLRPRRKTAKTGAASTDAQALEELAAEHEIARHILDYRELAKLKGTYVDALPRLVDPTTGRVHTSYDPTGAATGRLSSSDPNLQNIPVRSEAGRRIRAAFVPEAGHAFLAADYSQIELRVLAHMTGDPGLVAAFRSGEDIHRHTAAQVFGVLPELVDDTMRRRAKAVNFGLLYGMSETRLAREQGMTRAEAHRFVEAYFERFAGVRDYIEKVRTTARREGQVRTLFGRRRTFPQLGMRTNRGEEEQALRAAVNATIQGTAADLMKLAMLRVEQALEESGAGVRMLLQVHDELLFEVPVPEVGRAAETVREAMQRVWPLAVPLVVDVKSGASWLEVT